MLCGNKSDLRSAGQARISLEDGETMAKEHQAIFIETSSKDGNNILEALVQLSRYCSCISQFFLSVMSDVRMFEFDESQSMRLRESLDPEAKMLRLL